jgi:hypothetical protein
VEVMGSIQQFNCYQAGINTRHIKSLYLRWKVLNNRIQVAKLTLGFTT